MRAWRDSPSAAAGRPDVVALAEMIAYIAKRYDPDGVDLRFMGSDKKLEKCKQASEVRSTIQAVRFEGKTSITKCLNDLLGEYIQRLDNYRNGRRSMFGRRSKMPGPITYYILTDGVWMGGNDDIGQRAIITLTKRLNELGLPREQVGIQFISFGSDEGGLARLEKLDKLNTTQAVELYVYPHRSVQRS